MIAAASWTEDRVDRLKVMFAEGGTASEIAFALGKVTRNAVIGKVHRLGLARPPKAKPNVKAASIPTPRAASSRKHPGNIVARGAAGASERREGFQAIADKALENFDRKVGASRPDDDAGVLFLERGLFQCAMPLPGWDDLDVTEKRVCGGVVLLKGNGGRLKPTSYCAGCSALVYAPPRFREFKDRDLKVSA